MKKLIVIVALTFALCWAWVSRRPVVRPPAKIDVQGEVVAEIPAEITAINELTAQIKSIAYQDVVVTSNQNAVTIRGSVYYEKETRFRMFGTAFRTKEIDIGSNDTYFWFWSRRTTPPVLYYAEHKNQFDAGLKSAFNPAWLRETISINRIQTDGAVILREGTVIKIYQQAQGSFHEPQVRMTKLDGQKVVGYYLYDAKGTLIISADIEEHYLLGQVYLPKRLKVYWAEEDVVTNWQLGEPIVNSNLPASLWEMPNIKRIELGKKPT